MSLLTCAPNGQCACDVFYYYDANSASCQLINSTYSSNSVDSFEPPLPTLVDHTIQLADTTIILVTMLIIIGVWVLFTTALRFMPMKGIWFRLRRFVRWVDYAYSKRHWMDEQKCQVRRKTELGGVMSVATIIFIIGFVVSDLYQYFSFHPYSVQSIIPNAGDSIGVYKNDLSFETTVLSNMTCKNYNASSYRLTSGLPPYQQELTSRQALLNITVECVDTSLGPKVVVFCGGCFSSRDNYLNTFEMFSSPDAPAVAYGLMFNATVSAQQEDQSSYTRGTIIPVSEANVTGLLIGGQESILNYRFVPRIFRGLKGRSTDLRLIQAFFHEYISGSLATNDTQLEQYLANGTLPLKITAATQILSTYEVFSTVVNNRSVISLLSSIGGLYKLGILLFFLLLNMTERYFISVRYDDKLLDRMAKKKIALYHWRKLRIAVKYSLFHHLGNDTDEGTVPGTASASADPVPARRSTSRRLPTLPETTSAAKKPRTWSAWFNGLLKGGDGLGHSDSHEAMELQEAIEEVAQEDPATARAVGKGSREASTSHNTAKFPSLFRPPSLNEGPMVLPAALVNSAANVGQKIKTAAEGKLKYFQKWQEKQKKKAMPAGVKVYNRYADTRKGSESEHEGTIIRQNRAPSWIEDYHELPSVPEFPKNLEKYLDALRQRHEEEEKREGISHEELKQPNPIELYNFLVDMDEYQARLRVDFLLSQSMIENIVQRFRPHSDL